MYKQILNSGKKIGHIHYISFKQYDIRIANNKA